MENEVTRLSESILRLSHKASELHFDFSKIAQLLEFAKEIDIISSDIQALSRALESLAEAIETNLNITHQVYSLANRSFTLSQNLVDQATDISIQFSPILHEQPLRSEKWTCASKWMFYKSAYKCTGIYMAAFKHALDLLANALSLREATNDRRHTRTLSNLQEHKIAVERETLQLRNYLVDPSTIDPFIQHHYLAVVPGQGQSLYRAVIDSGPLILDVAHKLYADSVFSAEDKMELKRFQEGVEQRGRERGLDPTSGILYFETSFTLQSVLESVSSYVGAVIEEDRRSQSSSSTSHPSPFTATRLSTSTDSQRSLTIHSLSDASRPPPYTEFDISTNTNNRSSGHDQSISGIVESATSARSHDGSPPHNRELANLTQRTNNYRSSPTYSLFPPSSRPSPHITHTTPSVANPSARHGELHITPSYSTLNSTLNQNSDAASNRFGSTDTLIRRNFNEVDDQIIHSNPGERATSDFPVSLARNYDELPEVAIADLPEVDVSRDNEASEPALPTHRGEPSERPRRSSELLPPGMRRQTKSTLSNDEWSDFINNGTSLGDSYVGGIIEFQDALGTIHPLPLDRCKIFKNLVDAIHSRLRLRIQNPDSIVRIRKAFDAPLSDVVFYKVDYNELPKGEIDFKFCVSPLRWSLEAHPNIRVCIKFTSARLDNYYGLERWRDLHSSKVSLPHRKSSVLGKVLSKKKA